VGEIGESEVRPNRFGEIDDDVRGRIPGRKHARFRFALGIDGPVEKSQARVAASGIGEHAKPVFGRLELSRDYAESRESFSDCGWLKARGGGDFIRGVPVMGHHILEPVLEILLRGRHALFLVGSRRGGGVVCLRGGFASSCRENRKGKR
jgi:hypothetical protein